MKSSETLSGELLSKPVGILALQGDFSAHQSAFRDFGAETVLIRYPDQLGDLSALVLPGGESTTHLKALQESQLWEAIPRTVRGGLPIFATCAGLILCAREVVQPVQPSWNLLNIAIERNAWGRQKESFIAKEAWPLLGEDPQEMVFIRAPRITAVGGGVEVIGEYEGEPVFVRQGAVFGATFHPELSHAHDAIRLFLANLR
ncbi:MAG: pyridoxal 5'-phosphate synthase glutaminase subunit PdxT [Deltaproteobacteria bacterium]|nr:pyridoxal 5'-phosphate synthase glutaminase subunit PdxT [Deltaproteobacteria bacterium]